jgi:predicted nuclease of predicted toxin-antitoxin system
MKIFADENMEAGIVRLLRQDGQDVLYGAEILAAAPDRDVLQKAAAEQRVVITNDLDFGELVFHRKLLSSGVVLLRLKARNLAEKLRLFAQHWPRVLAHLPGTFVVVTNTRIRVRDLNPPSAGPAN